MASGRMLLNLNLQVGRLYNLLEEWWYFYCTRYILWFLAVECGMKSDAVTRFGLFSPRLKYVLTVGLEKGHRHMFLKCFFRKTFLI